MGDAENKPQFVPQSVVDGFTSYRDAVLWCWKNRKASTNDEKLDQSLCANKIGLYTPHMSRCVDPNSKAPMNLPPDLAAAFEGYTGWNAIIQYIAKIARMTIVEQIIAERNSGKSD
jgi:hypothetical protein